jgi:hypothetical protein
VLLVAPRGAAISIYRLSARLKPCPTQTQLPSPKSRRALLGLSGSETRTHVDCWAFALAGQPRAIVSTVNQLQNPRPSKAWTGHPLELMRLPRLISGD